MPPLTWSSVERRSIASSGELFMGYASPTMRYVGNRSMRSVGEAARRYQLPDALRDADDPRHAACVEALRRLQEGGNEMFVCAQVFIEHWWLPHVRAMSMALGLSQRKSKRIYETWRCSSMFYRSRRIRPRGGVRWSTSTLFGDARLTTRGSSLLCSRTASPISSRSIPPTSRAMPTLLVLGSTTSRWRAVTGMGSLRCRNLVAVLLCLLLECSRLRRSRAARGRRRRRGHRDRYCFFGGFEDWNMWHDQGGVRAGEPGRLGAAPLLAGLQLRGEAAATMAAGTAPDVIDVQDEPFAAYSKMGQFEDLGPYVARTAALYAPERFFHSALETFRVNGIQYGLPWNGGQLMIYYNRKLFREAGLRIPRRGTGRGRSGWRRARS